MKVLKEYLVTVYYKDGTSRGAYTLYGETEDVVSAKATNNLKQGEMFLLKYVKESVFQDWMLTF